MKSVYSLFSIQMIVLSDFYKINFSEKSDRLCSKSDSELTCFDN